MTSISSTYQKISGSNAGKTGRKKTDGYAGRRPDVSMIGTKVGKNDKIGYSGPPVAMGSLK